MSKNVFEYYKKIGWAKNDQGYFVDTGVNENLQKVCNDYNTATRRRVLWELQDQPGCEYKKILDCASGPVQYPEYIEYSSDYKSRYCVDFSMEALRWAEENLRSASQKKCHFICNDFFEEPFEPNYFDSTISLHTLYHVDKELQEAFVNKLIECTKPGMKVIIIYSNPFSLRACFALPLHLLLVMRAWIKNHIFGKSPLVKKLYFARHPIGWWKRFSNRGEVRIKSYRSFTPVLEKFLIPDNIIGGFIYDFLFKFEKRNISKYLSDYYMVVIKKSFDIDNIKL